MWIVWTVVLALGLILGLSWLVWVIGEHHPAWARAVLRGRGATDAGDAWRLEADPSGDGGDADAN